MTSTGVNCRACFRPSPMTRPFLLGDRVLVRGALTWVKRQADESQRNKRKGQRFAPHHTTADWGSLKFHGLFRRCTEPPKETRPVITNHAEQREWERERERERTDVKRWSQDNQFRLQKHTKRTRDAGYWLWLILHYSGDLSYSFTVVKLSYCPLGDNKLCHISASHA